MGHIIRAGNVSEEFEEMEDYARGGLKTTPTTTSTTFTTTTITTKTTTTTNIGGEKG